MCVWVNKWNIKMQKMLLLLPNSEISSLCYFPVTFKTVTMIELTNLRNESYLYSSKFIMVKHIVAFSLLFVFPKKKIFEIDNTINLFPFLYFSAVWRGCLFRVWLSSFLLFYSGFFIFPQVMIALRPAQSTKDLLSLVYKVLLLGLVFLGIYSIIL